MSGIAVIIYLAGEERRVDAGPGNQVSVSDKVINILLLIFPIGGVFKIFSSCYVLHLIGFLVC